MPGTAAEDANHARRRMRQPGCDAEYVVKGKGWAGVKVEEEEPRYDVVWKLGGAVLFKPS